MFIRVPARAERRWASSVLDDQLYVQTYGQAGNGTNSDAIVHRVRPDGITGAFRIPGGDLWALKRVR